MDSTYFSTLAQVSGVIVGFANLANLIYKPDIQTRHYVVNKIRILASTELGLFIICACLLPILFESDISSQENLFKALSLLIAFFVPFYCWLITTRSQKAMGTRFPVRNASSFFYALGIAWGIASGLNFFGAFGEGNIARVYKLAVFGCFIVQSALFIRLIYWILDNQNTFAGTKDEQKEKK